MKKLSALLASLFICLLMTSCSKSPSGDPVKDATALCNELVKAAESKDYDKANDLMNKYCDYYKEKSLEDRFLFIKNLKRNDVLDNETFREFSRTDEFEKLSGNQKLDLLFKKTKSEAREKGLR